MKSSSRSCKVVILVAGVLSGPFSFAADEGESGDAAGGISSKVIDDLIRQLGDDQFKNREDASRKLIKIGAPALNALRNSASNSQDAEIRTRSHRAITAVRINVRKKEIAGVKLVDDEKYESLLKKLLDAKPPERDKTKLYRWYIDVVYAQVDARKYDEAEKHTRNAMKMNPKSAYLTSLLSVCLGKQAKFEAAAEAATRAMSMKNADTMYLKIIRTEWEFGQGLTKKASAGLARLLSEPEPREIRKRSLYVSCYAAIYAATAQEKKLEEAIKKDLRMDGSDRSRKFYHRNAIYDAYRARPWFINLVGRTLRQSNIPSPQGSARAESPAATGK